MWNVHHYFVIDETRGWRAAHAIQIGGPWVFLGTKDIVSVAGYYPYLSELAWAYS